MVQKKRVIVVYWKHKPENPFEVFSSLKNFCLSYKGFNYNTLSNYLSKGKIAYENPDIRLERKDILLRPKPMVTAENRRAIVPVVRKVKLQEARDSKNDLQFWLKKTALDRTAAVTALIMQFQVSSIKMDRTKIVRRKMSI